MASSNQKNKLFDPIRKVWVRTSPEEVVRQSVLSYMLTLGYPPSVLGVEMALHHLNSKIPFAKRADIIVFHSSQNPLMIIECKATRITPSVMQQVLAYHYYIPVLYVVCVGKETLLCAQCTEKDRFLEYFPSYEEVCRTALETGFI